MFCLVSQRAHFLQFKQLLYNSSQDELVQADISSSFLDFYNGWLFDILAHKKKLWKKNREVTLK